MKKILFLFLILVVSGLSWYSWTLAQSTESSTETVCTQEWAPVCGQPPMNCPDDTVCAQVMPAPKTYSNKCHLYADSAEYLYQGECKDTTEVVEPICPVYDYASPPEGCWYEWYKDELGCKKAKLQCKTQCPVYSEPQEKEGCTIRWYTDDNGCKKYKQTCESTVCTQEYAPVCGKKKLHECCGQNPPESCQVKKVDCSQETKTFSNKCMMNSSGYTFLNAGECGTETVCPVYKMEEAPKGCWYEYETNEKGCKKPILKCKEKVVCKDYSTIKLMSEMDGCPLVWYTDENGCKNHKYVCANQEQTTTISDREQKLKERIKESLEKLFKRMDQSDKTNEEKIEHFQKIIIKLMAIGESRPKYEAIISYTIDLIENEIAELQDDEGMEDIFKLLE